MSNIGAGKLEEIVTLARAMLLGEKHLIEGVREINALLPFTEVANDEVFHQLIATDDETDRFPLGAVRQRWSSAALDKSDLELDKYITSARSDILLACEQIVRKFGGH